MAEGSEAPKPSAEGNRLVEKIGKAKLRAIAAIALAGAGLLGISGKPDSGVGTAVSVLNPFTGENVLVGVAVSTTIGQDPMGISSKIYEARKLEAYQVSIGGAKLTVYKGDIEEKGIVKTMLGVYPAAETMLGKR